MKKIIFILSITLLVITSCKQEQKQDEVSNLKTFAKAYGYVKYFHPSDESSKIDWNNFAAYGADEIIKCNSQTEVIKTLNDLFRPIAPSIIFTETNQDYDFTAIDEKVSAEMKLTQSGNSLGGKVDDGKDEFTLLQSCCIDGYEVTIKYYAAGELLNHSGTVNSDFNKMDGSFTIRGIYAGTWKAERNKKSKENSNMKIENSISQTIEFLLVK